MIFPSIFPADNNNSAERDVFGTLAKLPPDDFDVYYGKTFRAVGKRMQDEYEIDFIIVDKRSNWIIGILT